MPSLPRSVERPFPRSLDPFDDEILPGYLLRLAHRLEISPRYLTALAGLRGNRYAPGRSVLLGLVDPAGFARAARLSITEVENMSLAALAGRYPPLRLQYLGKTREPQALLKEPWVFWRWTRYCPQCLAGDGTAIQRHHGGPWKRAWRLPIAFSCLTHRRLLLHLCPDCRQPVNQQPVYGHPFDLFIANPQAQLHPTQCRSGKPRPCGSFLGDAPLDGDELDPQSLSSLLTTQEQLTHLLAPNGPTTTSSGGQPTPAPLIFTDLRMLSELLIKSWPTARAFAPTAPIAEIIDQHTAELRHREGPQHQPAGKHRGPCRPPLPAKECGALLTTTFNLLNIPDHEDMAALIDEMLHNDYTGRLWKRLFLPAQHACSPGLSQAIAAYSRAHPPPPLGRRPRIAVSDIVLK
ncbi:TniQ family protein (plasmid) [Nocardia sp. NBC_01377]|uniref:TniQ family protein n=1 Tax=Nocardia sp. NBC_01377 TaxID=2903595 RepID=UPI002F908459